jgi:hypothetical protein
MIASTILAFIGVIMAPLKKCSQSNTAEEDRGEDENEREDGNVARGQHELRPPEDDGHQDEEEGADDETDRNVNENRVQRVREAEPVQEMVQRIDQKVPPCVAPP